jgi:predicted O-methyltransferase YrrM
MEQHLDGVAQTYFQLGKAAQFLGCGALLNYSSELLDQKLVREIEQSVADVPEFETKRFHSVFDFRFYRILMYAMVRARRPDTFVESGILHGLTSTFILEAMERNGHGRLISADLPSYPETGPSNQDGCTAVLPRGKEPGWVVPTAKCGRWQRLLGASTQVLPPILSQSGEIDCFLHDSEHTTQTMYEELELGWKHLRRGGVLICDNADMSSAFYDLVGHHRCPSILFSTNDRQYLDAVNLGLAIKERP